MLHKSISLVKGSIPTQFEFSINFGLEEEAAEYLISLLTEPNEMTLVNDKDEGGEGTTSVRMQGSSYQYRDGGHGWQGDWKVITLAELKRMIIMLAPHNRGDHWSSVGRFEGVLK